MASEEIHKIAKTTCNIMFTIASLLAIIDKYDIPFQWPIQDFDEAVSSIEPSGGAWTRTNCE